MSTSPSPMVQTRMFMSEKWYRMILQSIYRQCLSICDTPWWRHQMETFSALLTICAGNSPVPGEFPTQRPVTRSFDVFFDLRLNKRLSKQSRGWWFEALSRPLLRHCNVILVVNIPSPMVQTRMFMSEKWYRVILQFIYMQYISVIHTETVHRYIAWNWFPRLIVNTS